MIRRRTVANRKQYFLHRPNGLMLMIHHGYVNVMGSVKNRDNQSAHISTIRDPILLITT